MSAKSETLARRVCHGKHVHYQALTSPSLLITAADAAACRAICGDYSISLSDEGLGYRIPRCHERRPSMMTMALPFIPEEDERAFFHALVH